MRFGALRPLGLRNGQVISLSADLRSEHSHFLIAAQAVPYSRNVMRNWGQNGIKTGKNDILDKKWRLLYNKIMEKINIIKEAILKNTPAKYIYLALMLMENQQMTVI
jgi:hypothetical protein